MDIETKMKKLFDYQKFENNTRLGNIIEDTLEKGMMLSDEDLTLVNAAGDPFDKKIKDAKARR